MPPRRTAPALRVAAPLALVLALAFALAGPRAARAQCPLEGDLGGPAGYGADVVPKSDDGSSPPIDLTPAFPDGLAFFGATFTAVYVNVNGNLTFGSPLDLYTPTAFPTSSGVRMIAAFFADVDTTADRGDDNQIYWHVDPLRRRVVVTWLAVDHFDRSPVPGPNSFQAILTARPDEGPHDFDVELRYAAIGWTTGDASGGAGGLGGTPAQVGFDAGDGRSYASHPASRTAAIADLDALPSNHPSACPTGSVFYAIRASCGNHVVDDPAAEECDPAASTPGCSSLCTVASGFACTHVAGLASACSAGCGNGQRGPHEDCDDGDLDPGDGCSPSCRVEPGAACDLSVEPSRCNASCATDAGCSPSGYCAAGRCVGDLPAGAPCPRDAVCASDTCTAGLCCDAACDGPCESCALAEAPAQCLPLAAGTRVAACGALLCDGAAGLCPEACAADVDCAPGTFCDVDHACAPTAPPGGACERTGECAVGVCSAGVCCDVACAGPCERCDDPAAPGTCAALAAGTVVAACGAAACDGAGGACPAACAGDADCAADHFCDASHRCAPDRDRGGACDRDDACQSGACAAGTCCDVACDGPCERCDDPAARGACTPLAAGASAPACGPMRCDGQGGGCPVACVRDADCADDHFCDATHRCAPDRARGGACDRAAACQSGACADGVCCDATCDGPCARCDLAEARGTCTVQAAGAPEPACAPFRCGGDAACPTACAADGDCAAGLVCIAAACLAPAADAASCDRDAACLHGHCVGGVCCASACDGGCEACDVPGAVGLCAPLPADLATATCAAYRCDGEVGACPTRCDLDAQCAPGFFCGDDACLPVAGDGAGCARDAACASAFCADGTCLTLVIDAPPDGAALAARRPTFAGRAVPGRALTLHLGAVTGELTVPASGAWTWAPPSDLADGPYALTASLAEGPTAVSHVVIDLVAPALTIMAPAPQAVLPTGAGHVDGTSEPGAALTLVIARPPGELRASTTADLDGAWTLPFEGLADGAHTAVVEARDAAQNVAVDAVTFVVDAVPPTLAIDAPADHALVAARAVVVAGRGKPAASLALRHDGVEHASAVGASGTWAVDLGPVPDGVYTDVATLTDAAGRSATTAVTYTVDATPPALTLDRPADGATVTVAAVELGGTSEPGLAVAVTLDARAPVTATADPLGAWSITADPPLDNGVHRATATTVDTAGHTSEVTVTFAVKVKSLYHTAGGNACAGADPSADTSTGATLALALAGLALWLRARRRGCGRRASG